MRWGVYALKNSHYVLYFAPLTGAVFAVITMLLFVGEVLQGVVFPVFRPLETAKAVGIAWSFTNSLLPVASKDYALLFLWCFIAGFAERFIPDTLTQLSQRATVVAASPKITSPTGGTDKGGSGLDLPTQQHVHIVKLQFTVGHRAIRERTGSTTQSSVTPGRGARYSQAV